MNLNGPEKRDSVFELEEPVDFEEEGDVSDDQDEDDGFVDLRKHPKRHRFDDSDPPERHDHKKRDAGKRRFHPKGRHEKSPSDENMGNSRYDG